MIALPGGRSLESLLYGVGVGDPATLAAAAGGLALVGLLASWVPAERATRLDPHQVLRFD